MRGCYAIRLARDGTVRQMYRRSTVRWGPRHLCLTCSRSVDATAVDACPLEAAEWRTHTRGWVYNYVTGNFAHFGETWSPATLVDPVRCNL